MSPLQSGDGDGYCDSNEVKLMMNEWHNLLENPAPEWLTERSWNDILCLNILPNFRNIAVDFQKYLDDFKRIFDSSEPHREELPDDWKSKLKILILKCLRSDKVTNAMQDFGQMFIEPQGPRPEAMMRAAQERSKWVFFQNCHLAPSWMPSLERLIDLIEPDKVTEETAKDIIQHLPNLFHLKSVMEQYPILYEQSRNTVLVQEVIMTSCMSVY
ncbi:dynein heavy chain 1, axonemal isoform X2 [Octopus vulgaris]|uniref:Dynein heavy chain 1, axonemal isoform X2 n=1 Tax=Octopus vulgaris TaxID=6645 RepID=A0AA36BME7_OCTVU|nr:dynein heavy chain 1, axonemal isoform X2 [Octopus vulgaris]